MAQKSKKPAKAKAVVKKAAPSKAKKPAVKVAKPVAKAKPKAVKKQPAPAKKPVAVKKIVKKPAPAAKKATPAKKVAPAKKAAPVKKPVSNKPAAPIKKSASAKKPVVKAKPVSKKPLPKKPAAKVSKAPAVKAAKPAVKGKPQAAAKGKLITVVKVRSVQPVKVTGWLAKQRDRLLALKDTLLDSMSGVGKDSLRSRAEGSEASAFGMHTADAGSDAYDRDFALSLLSQERDSLFEIDAALKKIEQGNYGSCEMSGKPIPHARLEALPFARYTVECQSELEKSNRLTRVRQPVTSLFGLNEDEGAEGEEDEINTDSKE
jgi:RNA polymerase-binding transcription factor DksA